MPHDAPVAPYCLCIHCGLRKMCARRDRLSGPPLGPALAQNVFFLQPRIRLYLYKAAACSIQL